MNIIPSRIRRHRMNEELPYKTIDTRYSLKGVVLFYAELTLYQAQVCSFVEYCLHLSAQFPDKYLQSVCL